MARSGSPLETFLVALRLGLTSFGGPIAHIGFFRDEYVARRRWLDEQAFADVVAMGQVLPGPASSQVGIAIGALRAGPLGSLTAWLGFTLPSAALLIAFAYGVGRLDVAGQGWLRGIAVVAVAVVLQAVLAMARSLCVDLPRRLIALAALPIALAWAGLGGQLLVIGLAALAGVLLVRPAASAAAGLVTPFGRRLALGALVVLVGLLVLLPILRGLIDSHELALADSFFRTGALVFGGGHVVLPLLHAEVVEPGWVTNEAFVAGYGAAQAVPGPLFTFAGYLGAVAGPEPNGWVGGVIAVAAIFAPSFLLVACALPLLGWLRARPRLAGAMAGVNAGVVGLLAAAFYDPVVRHGIDLPVEIGIAVVAFVLLVRWTLPPWLVVGLGAATGALLDLGGVY